MRCYDDEFDPTALPRVLSRTHARRLGFTDAAIEHQLDIKRWRLVLPHTLLTSDTFTWRDRLSAALAFAGTGALLSGPAALADLGLRSVQRPSTVLVLVPPDRQPRSVAWVRVRPSARPVRRAELPGPARAEIARCVGDTCLGRRRQDDVRALVAEAVRLGLCTIDELAVELRRGPQRGSAFIREAIEEIGGGAWSAPEARAAKLMRRAGFPTFEQNVKIDLPNGDYYIGDFIWYELWAILEIDSDSHHTLAGGDGDNTSDRHILLETLGYSTVHRTPRLIVKHPQKFLDGVGAWLAARAQSLA
jgi:very-short-patch-repair endonuclease